MNVPILYEDNHLLFVEKPVNVPVQGDRTNDLDLLSYLKEDLKIRYQKPGNVYLGLVHRLDRPVGGVMVFAKTSKAASRLSDIIRRNAIKKRYLAVVRGNPSKNSDKLEDYLVKDRQRNIVHTAKPNNKNAKKAILEYEVIGSKKGLSLLSIRLHTGRSHQIRVQLSSRGFPLYGDQKYGMEVNQPGQQIALWSNMLAFEHPTTKEEINLQSKPPNEYPWNLW
ncbi:RNA pseudouridine synthase [Virgibacillus profundi]|uniref:RNA pseudouridylate synthase n=1 Tax=Virgibacillus profundi TaxID=2024555 RepID=A0A2A2ID55_9BACI|nr:RluA family pseudouridine synthase [Virgibacillus profundi]PAV29003.1 RNA pseudouridine synthase [Virgibacillus profundi]PXY53171.1 RluA family pseudouridine synthase [Virgibacillus profundi]